MTRMRRARWTALIAGLTGLLGGLYAWHATAEAVGARTVASPYTFNFNTAGTIEEAGSADASSSPYWWLNSGGRFIISGGTGKTLHGDLPSGDRWRLLYAAANSRDTDRGFHPQNLFRLVSRSKWLNYTQSVAFRINRLIMSGSPERNAWSGVLMFNRYLDGNNLYYIGIRHDGKGIIKKKRWGKYYTLAEKQVYAGGYDRDSTPNLIPGKRWIGLRSIVKTQSNGSVLLQLAMDYQMNGNWQVVVQYTDTSGGSDGAPITSQGYTGIRSDYMDIEFDNYRLERSY